MRMIPSVKVYNPFIAFMGGLDMATPPLLADPGTVFESENVYQGDEGGYYTFQGYEPFDGQAPPTSALFYKLYVNFTSTVIVGDVLTGLTSFGTVVYVSSDYVVLVSVSGIYNDTANQTSYTDWDNYTDPWNYIISETVYVSGAPVGTAIGTQRLTSSPGVSSPALGALFKSLGAIARSAEIAEIPGSGDVLGVWKHDGAWYGFRNNEAGLATEMYKSTSAGWEKVELGFELEFTAGGTYEPQEGDVITGAVSGATAIITRVVLESSSFANSTATGRFIFASQVGTFEAETLNIDSEIGVATIAGDSSAITFANPSGRFKFISANYTGSTATLRTYGCDGVNRGFEFDGTVFVPINTGMVNDYPEDVFEHKNHLFFSFLGEVQFSSPGFPFRWSVVVNAGAIGLGDKITGFSSLPGSADGAAMLFSSEKSTHILYGSSVDDWNPVPFDNEVGVIEHSLQNIGNTFFMSNRGVVKLATSQVYGNFEDATETQKVKKWLKIKKSQVTASCVVREKNLYIVFFNDGTALCNTVKNGEIVASMPLTFDHKVTCISSVDDVTEGEQIMFGSSDGKVRQLFSGNGFDGEVITWFFNMHYNNLGSPMVNKRYRGGHLEVAGTGYSGFTFSYKVDYGSKEQVQFTQEAREVALSISRWESFIWEDFIWDGVSLIDSGFDMTGEGANFSLVLRSNSQSYNPLEFSGAIVQYSPTRGKR